MPKHLLFALLTLCLPLFASAEEPAEEGRQVTIKFDTPSSGYSVKIVEAYQVGDELWVVSQVKGPPKGSFGLTVITPVKDSVKVPAAEDLKVRHKVVGKTWNWGKNTDELTWVKSLAAVDEQLKKEMGKAVWQLGGPKGTAKRRGQKVD